MIETCNFLTVLWSYGPDTLSLQQVFQMAHSVSAAAFSDGTFCLICSTFSMRHQPNELPKQDKHTFFPFSHSIDLWSWHQTISHILYVQAPQSLQTVSPSPAEEKFPVLVSTCHLCMSWSMLVAAKNSTFPMNNARMAEWHHEAWDF